MSDMSEKSVFKYFAYGSNMLTERIHINNPSARFLSVGTLKNYRFGFEKGVATPASYRPAATIRRGTADDHVMGCVWEIDANQVHYLDRQEKRYTPMTVDVLLDDSTTAQCRTYEMLSDMCPGATKPHPFYKKICIEGAKQHCLPKEYIQFLERFEDTQEPRMAGYYDALVPVLEKLAKMN